MWSSDGCAERRVPLVVAAGPGQHRVDGGDGGHQVVHRPADDRVVVHAHVDVDHADCVADTCGKNCLDSFSGYLCYL